MLDSPTRLTAMLNLLLLFSSCSLSHGSLLSPVDIGYDFNANTLYGSLGNFESFNLTVSSRQETLYWYAANSFSAPEHGGTHLDAPFHFYKQGWKVADIPLNRLLVQGVMIDLTAKVAGNADFNITADDLIEWEERYGPLPNEVVILINFGWASKYPDRLAYFGGTSNSDLHFPGVSESAANWIVKTGKVVGVGVDTPSVDTGVNKEFIAHRILLTNSIYVLENVALAKAILPPRNFKLAVMPMKIAEGSGAPLRLIAYPNTEPSSN
uniref:Cyclase n=1 Tax=Clastoptera arizonana TaxID=38151 RepID=A0A1B6DEI5_9HEMI